jgi:hypothetical protein
MAVNDEDAVADMLQHVRVALQFQPLALDPLRQLAPLDRPAQRGGEVLAIDRLLDVVVRAAAERLDGEVVLAVTGDQQGGGLRPQGLDLVQQGETVHAGHLDVGDDGVEVLVSNPRERGGRGIARLDVQLAHPQPKRLGQRLEQGRVVVDDQDSRVQGRASSASVGGSVIVNSAPPSRPWPSSIVPPCSVTMP